MFDSLLDLLNISGIDSDIELTLAVCSALLLFTLVYSLLYRILGGGS